MPHPKGRFCPFRIDAKKRLQLSRYSSNKRFNYHGDAFMLRHVNTFGCRGEDLSDSGTIGCSLGL